MINYVDYGFRDPLVPLTPQQRELRAKVLVQIEDEPSSFDMDSWEFVAPDDEIVSPSCRTTRCIGGWTDFFATGYVRCHDIGYRSIRNLGLTEREYWGTWQRPPGFAPGRNSLFIADNDEALARMRVLVTCPHEEIAEK